MSPRLSSFLSPRAGPVGTPAEVPAGGALQATARDAPPRTASLPQKSRMGSSRLLIAIRSLDPIPGSTQTALGTSLPAQLTYLTWPLVRVNFLFWAPAVVQTGSPDAAVKVFFRWAYQVKGCPGSQANYPPDCGW